MGENKEFKEIDFDTPSFLFRLSDSLVYILGGAGYYNSYINSIPLQGKEYVLDFGCGGGIASKMLIKRLPHGKLTCLEPSKCWIRRLRRRLKKYQNVSFINDYIENVDSKDDTFDVILIHHVLHDIHPQKRQDVIAHLSRNLKPEGSIYIREPLKRSHGMPVDEIRQLFKNVDREEVDFSIKIKKEYTGIYQ